MFNELFLSGNLPCSPNSENPRLIVIKRGQFVYYNGKVHKKAPDQLGRRTEDLIIRKRLQL